MILTAELLRAATGCTQADAELYAPHLARACAVYEINTPERLAMFLGPGVAHESRGLARTTEAWGPTAAQVRYERDPESPWPANADDARLARCERNRLAYRLGNTDEGDGRRYCGHGLIHITGRGNHARVRDRLRERLGLQQVPDFELYPEALTRPEWAAWSAADYWDDRRINPWADAGDLEMVTRRINGGTNGLDDRRARWHRATAALQGQAGPLLADRQPAAPMAPPQPAEAPAGDPGAPAPAPLRGMPAGEGEPQPEPAMPPTTQPVAAPAATATSNAKESTMAPLLGLLAQNLIAGFAPLAAEKVQKAIERHTDSPQVAEHLAAAVMSTAQQLTGKADPVEAVAAAKASPEVMAQVEASALDTLDRLAPLLDKLEGWDRQRQLDDDASRDAAAARAAGEHDPLAMPLLWSSLAGAGLLLVFVGAVVVVQIVRDGRADTEVWAALTGLIGWVTAKSGSIYDYRFGSSRGAAARDALIGELSRRR